MISLTPHARGTVIAVKAQPGARRNSLLGVRGGALRIGVTAAPERGKANEAVSEVLAEALGIKASQVSILTGQTSRNKRYLIEGATSEALEKRLSARLGSL